MGVCRRHTTPLRSPTKERDPLLISRPRYSRCIILVADGARYDETERRLLGGKLPNIQKHIVDRGSFQRAISVFPSTTGPAHIPFVSGVHPGTANVTGYRWLDRELCDNGKGHPDRFRTLNSPRGLFMGLDMIDGMPSLFDHFERPSAIMEPADLCNNGRLYRIIFRRLAHLLYAHNTHDWIHLDRLVESTILRRIRAGSECIVATFLGIDEYSHLGGPTDPRVGEAYERIDAAVGRIAESLRDMGWYDDTILVVVSDHGQTGTDVHIPLVDILLGHRFEPFHFPRRFTHKFDSAVMESGNAMAQLYFRRDGHWGNSWTLDEMATTLKIERLILSLISTRGVPFVIARSGKDVVTFRGQDGTLRAEQTGGTYEISCVGKSPLPGHPIGQFDRREISDLTFGLQYPDAINQAFRLFESSRSGDLIVCADPGFDLRLKNERPEHRGSHGALHRDHMSVPIAISVPLREEIRSTCDIPSTILAAVGKKVPVAMEGITRPLADPINPTAHVYIEQNGHPDEETLRSRKPSSVKASALLTACIVAFGLVLTAIYQERLMAIGENFLQSYGQNWMDGVLFAITAVSSTPLFLPIWGYALVGISMDYGVVHLAIVMALGSATGSLVTYLIGRYLGETDVVNRRLPQISQHPWTEGRPRSVTTIFLFLGTASPIPCDVLYAACGLKKYPWLLFWTTLVFARIIRYLYLGFGFRYVLAGALI